jgi:hypothetical protein
LRVLSHRRLTEAITPPPAALLPRRRSNIRRAARSTIAASVFAPEPFTRKGFFMFCDSI